MNHAHLTYKKALEKLSFPLLIGGTFLHSALSLLAMSLVFLAEKLAPSAAMVVIAFPASCPHFKVSNVIVLLRSTFHQGIYSRKCAPVLAHRMTAAVSVGSTPGKLGGVADFLGGEPGGGPGKNSYPPF